jgi:hypothetical protein
MKTIKRHIEIAQSQNQLWEVMEWERPGPTQEQLSAFEALFPGLLAAASTQMPTLKCDECGDTQLADDTGNGNPGWWRCACGGLHRPSEPASTQKPLEELEAERLAAPNQSINLTVPLGHPLRAVPVPPEAGDALLSPEQRSSWIAAVNESPDHTCLFCGSPSHAHPGDQEAPANYCSESDHGYPEEGLRYGKGVLWKL